MKINILYISKIFMFALAFITILLNSCSKEEKELPSNNKGSIITLDYQLPTVLKTGITFKNGMMVFESKTSFNSLTYLLENETVKYIETYIQKAGDVTEVELNTKMEMDCFSPFTVYEAFEKYYSFYSLRKKLEELEDKWLNESKKNLTINNNPTLYPLSERCLNIANINGEYMINSTIYRVEPDGLVYEIINSDFQALSLIRSGKYNIWLKGNNSNVIIHNKEVRSMLKSTMSSCKAYVRHTRDYNYTDKRKMHCILDLDWDGWGSAAKAKVQCYKYVKSWGTWKWKRHWTDMGTSLCVQDRDMDCNIQEPYGLQCNSKYKNWAYYVSTHVYGAGSGLRVKPGEYGGVYKKNGYNDFSISW